MKTLLLFLTLWSSMHLAATNDCDVESIKEKTDYLSKTIADISTILTDIFYSPTIDSMKLIADYGASFSLEEGEFYVEKRELIYILDWDTIKKRHTGGRLNN